MRNDHSDLLQLATLI